MGRAKKTKLENQEGQNEITTSELLKYAELTDDSSNPGEEIEESSKEKTPEEISEENKILENLSKFRDEPDENKVHPIKRKRKTKTTEQPVIENPLPVSPKFLITITDRAMSNLAVTVDRLTNKKSTVKSVDISMTVEERDDFIPQATECLKAMKMHTDPVTAFFGGMALLTLTKYIMIRQDSK